MGRKPFHIPLKPILVYLPKEQVERIDKLANQHGRSRFIRDAVEEKIKTEIEKQKSKDTSTQS